MRTNKRLNKEEYEYIKYLISKELPTNDSYVAVGKVVNRAYSTVYYINRSKNYNDYKKLIHRTRTTRVRKVEKVVPKEDFKQKLNDLIASEYKVTPKSPKLVDKPEVTKTYDTILEVQKQMLEVLKSIDSKMGKRKFF